MLADRCDGASLRGETLLGGIEIEQEIPFMIGTRIAGGVLAVAALAGATACNSPAQSKSTPATTSTVATTSAKPSSETLTPLIAQALPNVPGKTLSSLIVDYPPGVRSTPHRHGDAFVYAYVLNGAVRSQVNDGPVTTYRQGENWVEQPGDHHVLSENASQTERARLLVIFIANTGDNLKVDDPHS
jgi:quercetin dioxygenase-like cupin family protein